MILYKNEARHFRFFLTTPFQSKTGTFTLPVPEQLAPLADSYQESTENADKKQKLRLFYVHFCFRASLCF